MKAKDFLEQEADAQKPQDQVGVQKEDPIQQTMASEPIPLETAKEEFNKKAAEFEFSGISVNDIKIGPEGTTLTLQQGNVSSNITFVWGAEEEIGPFAEIKPQQGDTINLDLTPLSPPVVDTKGTGRQIDISNLTWLTKEAFDGLMDACGFKEVPDEQEEPETQPGEGSGAPKQTATSPAVELDAKTVPAPAPQGQPGESLSEAVYDKAVAFGMIKEAPDAWLKEEDSYTVTVQKGKDTFNVTVGGTSDSDAKKKAKDLTKADKVMNASKMDKKKAEESKDEKIHTARICPKCKSEYVGWKCKKCGYNRKKKESIDQRVDTQMKCKACGHVASEPSFKRDEIKGYEYTCPKCDSHDVTDAPSEITHDRMRKDSPGVEEEFGEMECESCGYKGDEEEFDQESYGNICPECGSENVKYVEREDEHMEDKNKVGLFRFIIREGKRIKIPLGEAKKKGKQPNKVVAQKPYTFNWNKKPPKEALDEKGKKVSGQGMKTMKVKPFKKQSWKRPTKEGLEESKKEFFTKSGLLK